MVDCLWSGYSVWSECSSTCGAGTRRRTRRVLQEAVNGGEECLGEEVETEDCDLPPCPSPSSPSSPLCAPTQPAEWSPCSATCGQGVRRRQKTVEVVSTDGTSQCGEEIEEEECFLKTCPGSGKGRTVSLGLIRLDSLFDKF